MRVKTLRKCQFTLLGLIALTALPVNWIFQLEHRGTDRETQFVVLAALAILLISWLLAGLSAMVFAKVLSHWRPKTKPKYWLWFTLSEVACLIGFAKIPVYGSATPFAIIFFGGGIFCIIAQRQIVKESRKAKEVRPSAVTVDVFNPEDLRLTRAS
jgi:lysylphosphatidylglycerol synthetase-like protein (DUF2156 family)